MAPLQPDIFKPLPVGAIRPAGWLLGQLRIQAGGLSGHLDSFWPSLRDSAWIGGTAEAWERGPYWLDGIIPLAFVLNDPELIARARHWVDYIVENQRTDGWLGPVLRNDDGAEAYDTWPLFVLFKALTQWHSATGDHRIVDSMTRAMRFILNHIRREPIFGWGRYRTADLLLSIQWLMERAPAPWLAQLHDLVQRQGFDWKHLFDRYPYTGKTLDLPRGPGVILASHGPNTAMGLKQPATRFRVTRDPADRDAIFEMIETLDRYHGQASGMFSCDEHLAGRSPTQGTELCAVVEYLFSLEAVFPILGTASAPLCDRWEQIAFNALPAAFSTDMWSHQYDQQVNQMVARRFEHPIWTDNNGDANTFGLEPHYGCCTANMHQGWPKVVSHLWMQQASDQALVALSFAPATVNANVAGAAVSIEVESDYPFDEVVILRVRADRATTIPLLLRIPGWATGATVDDEPATAGTFHALSVSASSTPVFVRVRLPMPIKLQQRPHGAVAVTRGPIVYALKMEEHWQHFRGDFPHCDYEVFSTSPWNVALELNRSDPASAFHIQKEPAGEISFSPAGAPVTLTVRARPVDHWRLDPVHGCPTDPPPSPVMTNAEPKEIELIPYGAAKLRMTELPWTAVE